MGKWKKASVVSLARTQKVRDQVVEKMLRQKVEKKVLKKTSRAWGCTTLRRMGPNNAGGAGQA
jgi:hypothetical protein